MCVLVSIVTDKPRVDTPNDTINQKSFNIMWLCWFAKSNLHDSTHLKTFSVQIKDTLQFRITLTQPVIPISGKY